MMNRPDEQSLLESQQRIHEMIVHQHSLSETLGAITNWIELMIPDALVSVMQYDQTSHTLSLVSGPRFSEHYVLAMQGIPVNAHTGTCGFAAHNKKLVITKNISTDSNWSGYHHLAHEEGLKACWSMPIIGGNCELLGTFATYYQKPHLPRENDLRSLARGAGLAALALLRDRDTHKHLVLTQWHQALFENHPDGVYTFDLQGRFLSGNRSFERISGYGQADIIGFHFSEFIDPAYRDSTLEAFQRACCGESVTYETAGRHARGHTYHLEITNFPVLIQSKIVGVYGICRDVSERKKQQCELRYLKRGIEASPHGLVLLDARQMHTPATYVNPAFLQITGYAPEEVIGRDLSFLEGPDTSPEHVSLIYEGLKNQTEVDVVIKNYRKDGSWFWNHLMIRPVFNEEKECSHFIEIQQDVTRERQQAQQITYQTTHDVLTGLLNQSAFTDLMNEAFEESKISPSLIGLLSIDLDDFKPINDGLGHHIGSRVLSIIGNRLKKLAGPRDFVARIAGDEFAILLRGYSNRTEIIHAVNRVLRAVGEPLLVGDRPIHLSASIGIACNSEPLDHAHELFHYADLALSEAKKQGRNTWIWSKDRREKATVHNVTVRQELHEALNSDQFQIHYQPILRTADQSICGVEALVRWLHPKRGLIMPSEFIPLSEQSGQIIPIGRWILHHACKEIGSLNDKLDKPLSVAVNISSLQFHRDGFLDDVRSALQAADMQPGQLELEVTESILLDGTDNVLKLMDSLKHLGVGVAIDDFGTGFSSLSYLCDLPTHKLKLDRTFVQRTKSEQRMAAIVEGVITMAHHMGMLVVAEGIETLEQHKELANRQCDQMQGFLFARPMPLSQLVTYLQNHPTPVTH